MGLTGKENLSPSSDEPFFLVDECLNKHIAEALKLIGYNIDSIEGIFHRPTGNPVTDKEIIDWLSHQISGMWITADHSAKRQRREQLLCQNVSTVWIKWPKKGMTSKQQHRVISYLIDPISRDIQASHKPLYFLAFYNADRPSRMKAQM